MWLPTWIGMNGMMKAELETRLKPVIENMEINERSLDRMHELVVDELCKINPTVDGLREYLDGLKYVQYIRTDGTQES